VKGLRKGRPAKRSRKSNDGTVLPDQDRQDATPIAARNVSFRIKKNLS
jgi:nucleolar protein 4